MPTHVHELLDASNCSSGCRWRSRRCRCSGICEPGWMAGWPAGATILPRFEAIRPPEVCRPSTGMAVRIAPPEKAQTNKQKSPSSSAASHTAYYSCNNNDPTPIVDKNLEIDSCCIFLVVRVVRSWSCMPCKRARGCRLNIKLLSEKRTSVSKQTE